MATEQGIQYSRFETEQNPDFIHADCFMTSTFNNYTHMHLYAVRADGEVIDIPQSGYNISNQSKLIVDHFWNSGQCLRGIASTSGNMARPFKNHLCEWAICESRLAVGPVYLSVLGLFVGSSEHIAYMKENHPLSAESQSRMLAKAVADIYSKGCYAPITILINSHDNTLNQYHVIVNDRLATVPVTHDESKPERILVYYNIGGRNTHFVLEEVDFTQNVITPIVFSVPWIMGRDRNAVQEQYNKSQMEDQKKFTDAEFKDRFNTATAEVQQELADAKTKISRLEQDLKLAQESLATTKLELDHANSGARASYEQQVLASKIAAQQLEAENLKTKQQLAREQVLMSMESDRVRMDADEKIAKAKVEKESLSVKSSEVSATATTWKTVAVLAPLAASAVYWFATHTAASIAAAPLAASTAPLGIAAIGVGLACYCSDAICKFGKSAFKKARKIAEACYNKTKSFLTNTYDCISSTCKKVWDWLTDW